MLQLNDYLKIFVALFAIMNPIGAIPVFITMSNGQPLKERLSAINTAAKSVAIILVLTLFMGEALLHFFNLSINSFRVGGGILVLLMGISMLQAKSAEMRHTKQELAESVERSEYAVVPLAIPLLVGPGAMSTVILFAQRGQSILHYLMILLAIAGMSLVTWVALRTAPVIADRLGQTGINIVTRIMGLLLSAFAVEFITTGLKGIFPALAS